MLNMKKYESKFLFANSKWRSLSFPLDIRTQSLYIYERWLTPRMYATQEMEIMDLEYMQSEMLCISFGLMGLKDLLMFDAQGASIIW